MYILYISCIFYISYIWYISYMHSYHAMPRHSSAFHCVHYATGHCNTFTYIYIILYYIIYRSTVYFYMLVMLGDNSEMNRIWMSKAYCTTDWRHLATKLAGHAASRWSGVKPGEVVIWHDMTVCWCVLWLSYDGSDGVVIGITWYHLCPEGYRFAVL